MPTMPMAVEVFCSYAHEDEIWLRKLETHLSPLKRQGIISLWHDRLLLPGTDWALALDTRLETASVVLLLVSADFFASDYCYGIEMKRALERHQAGEVRVIPILVRTVDWNGAPFAHLQTLPTNAKPLATWKNKDTALANVVAELRRTIEDLSLLTRNSAHSSGQSFNYYVRQLEILKKLEDKKLLRSEVVIKFQESIVAKLLDLTTTEIPKEGGKSE